MGISDRRSAKVVLWDIATKKNTAILSLAPGDKKVLPKGRERVAAALAFAPDGKTLALGCNDGTVELWDLAWRLDK